MNKKILITMTLFLFLIGFAAVVLGNPIPDDPHHFYGTVSIGGSVVPVGSTITATINSETRGTITTTVAGEYGSASGTKLTVTHYSTDTSSTITFSITATGCTATNTSTAEFEAGKTENKYLMFSGSCPTTAAATSGGGGGGTGGGAGAAKPVTQTLVADSSTIEDIKEALPSDWTNTEIYQYGSPSVASMETSASTIDSALSYATQTSAITELQNLKTAIEEGEMVAIPTTTVSTVYRIKNLDTGKWDFRTGVTITVTAPENLESFEVIEVIPASVASFDELVFIGEPPEVLQSEAGIILKWKGESLAKGASAEFKYFIKKNVASINTITLAGGSVKAEKPLPPTKEEQPPSPEKKPVPWVGIILIGAIIVIGLIIYTFLSKKKK